jgi:hypothetical protein
LPFSHLLEHRVGDPADQVGRDLDPVKLLQMRLDLTHRQAAGIEADDPIVEPVQPGLPLGHNLRFEAAVAVTRHRDLDRAVVADHRLARISVAAVAAAAAGRVAFLIAEMLAQLGTQRSLQQAFLQLPEQPVLAEQIRRRAIALQQLLDELIPDRLCQGP